MVTNSGVKTYVDERIVIEDVYIEPLSNKAVGANSYIYLTLGDYVFNKSGYTAKGILGVNLGSNALVLGRYWINSSQQLGFTIRNTNTSQQTTGTVNLTVLFVKN